MAEIGVLELQIKDNASDTAGGLRKLAGALDRVRNAVGNAVGLDEVAGNITKLSDAVVKMSQNSAVKQITELGKSIKSLVDASKLTKISFDTSGITALKKAIGDDGLHLGQAGTQLKNIRAAMEGWDAKGTGAEATASLIESLNNLKTATTGLKDSSSALKEMAEAIKVYAEATSMVSMDGFSAFQQVASSIQTASASDANAVGENITGGITSGLEAGKSEAVNVSTDVANAILDAVKKTLGIASPARAMIPVGRNAIYGINEGMISVSSTVQGTIRQIATDMVSSAQQIVQNADYSKINVADFISTPVASLRDRFIFAADASTTFKGNIDASVQSLRNYKDTVLSLTGTHKDVAAFSKKVGDDFVAPFKGSEQEVREATTGIKNAVVDNMEEINREINRQMAIKYQAPRQTFEEYYNHGLNGKLMSGMDGVAAQEIAIRDAAKNLGMTIDEVKQKLLEMSAASNGVDMSNVAHQLGSLQVNYGAEMVDNLMNCYSAADLLTIKMEGMQRVLADDINANRVDTQQVADRVIAIQNLRDKIEELRQAEEDAMTSTTLFGTSFKSLKEGITKAFPTLTNLLKRFKSMMVMRTLRYLIRELAKGLSEGVQNVYWYSKAVGTSFAPAMDDAASALLQMKNSIGAALAPAIQALIPYLKVVVNWVISIVNWFNQLFALLNGQNSWTEALPYAAEAFTDTTRSARAAAKETKGLLADWDELNIIQNESGSGGGGGNNNNTPDYQNMFREVTEFNDTIQSIVESIKETFGDIWGLIKKIGITLLAWKFSTAFAGLIGTLASIIAFVGVIDLEFNIVKFFDKQFLKTGNEGWLLGDILTTFVGGALMKKLLVPLLGKGAASVAIPIALTVSILAGVTTLLGDTDTTALTPEALELSALNALKGGALAGYLFYSAGFTGGLAFKVGAAAALFFMGINIGLKAISDTVDSHEITKETIITNFLSAGLVSGGLMLGEVILGGTIGTILTVGGVGFIATLGALFAIEAIIAKQPTAIHWEDHRWTQEQIEQFVTNSLMNGDIGVKLELRKQKVEVSEGEVEAMAKNNEKLTVAVNMLTIGVDVEQSLADIKSTVFGEGGILDTFRQHAKTRKELIEVDLSIVPIKNEKGENLSADFYKTNSQGWDFLESIMTGLGAELSNILRISEEKNMDANMKEMVAHNISTITGAMLQVQTTIAAARKRVEMNRDFESGLKDKNNIDDILDYYEEQKTVAVNGIKEVYKDYYDEVDAQILTFESLADQARQSGGEIFGHTAAEYEEQAELAKSNRKLLEQNEESSISAATDYYTNGQGKQKVHDAIMDILDVNPAEYIGGALANILGGELPRDWLISNLFDPESGAIRDGAQDSFYNLMDKIIEIAFPNDYERIKRLLDNGFITYADLFNDEFIHTLGTRLWNGTEMSGEVLDNWNNFIAQIFGKNGSNVEVPEIPLPEVVTKAQETIPIKTSFDEQEMKETIDAPLINTSMYKAGLDELETNTRTTIEEIRSLFSSLDGISLDLSTAGNGFAAALHAIVPGKASGGFVRSGDLVMANENGNFEMMGKMGSQPVVANNQQIVTGISQGVAQANSGVESRLNTIESLLIRMLNKEFVAKAVPSSNWGAHNARSNDAYDKVTG